MEKVIELLNNFFEAEVNTIIASDVPDLDDFNFKLNHMNSFVLEPLENSFGMIPIEELESQEYYEEAKDYPPPEKRFLFRIDQYRTINSELVFKCFVSNSSPIRASLFNLFIINEIDNEIKIHSVYHLSDRGMGGDKKWYYIGGGEEYMIKTENEYLLNEESLGEQIKINRILEPVATDVDGLKEYHKD